jgi:pimeloyl-ACP methyl ester carboxylesterase
MTIHCNITQIEEKTMLAQSTRTYAFGLLILMLSAPCAQAQTQATIVAQDYHIDAVDPGIKLFVRQKMAQGNTRFTEDNIVLFIHGATFPSTPDFDLKYKDYSWADWMVQRGYVVYMFDKRNYGFSSREKPMDEPAASNKPVSRSYLVIRDIAAVVDHIRAKHKVSRVSLIGWSWGAMTAGYYTSLNSEKVKKLVRARLCFPAAYQPRPGQWLAEQTQTV